MCRVNAVADSEGYMVDSTAPLWLILNYFFCMMYHYIIAKKSKECFDLYILHSAIIESCERSLTITLAY